MSAGGLMRVAVPEPEPLPDPRSLSTWASGFRQHVADLPGLLVGPNATPGVASRRLRDLVRNQALMFTDIRDQPERFFTAHSILSEYATRLGPGFGIRFTVQYNLFAGTVVALGSQEHLDLLDQIQADGQLGCFGLTEKLAGVNSGLVVETTCTWDPAAQEFELHTPNDGAQKNWISQGCTADWAVVVADLLVSGRSHGPHAFLMRLRGASGDLVPGVEITDMGLKTVGNDLDNASIRFDRVRLPRAAMLDRHCAIDEESGRYVQRVAGVSNMDMIGQRLYTGRMVIADSAVTFAKSIFASTREYSDRKRCWAPKSRPALSDMPQLQALYSEADERLAALDSFLDALRAQVAPLLREGRAPPREVVEAIAAGKVRCIETSIELCHRLKQEVGSFALMAGTGFERLDYLQCCKFAEGDSRILMQKMARDRLGAFKRAPGKGSKEELHICAEIAAAMKRDGPEAAWSSSWRSVYHLAELIIDRTLSEFCALHGPASVESLAGHHHQLLSKL